MEQFLVINDEDDISLEPNNDYFLVPTGRNSNTCKETATARPAAHIRFSADARVRPTLGLWQYTEREISATFLNKTEERDSQNDLVKCVRALRRSYESGEVLDDTVICTRGIEHFRSPEHIKKRKILKEMALMAVLEEQDSQRMRHMHDSHLLCEAEEHISKLHRAQAVETADRDAEYSHARRASLPAQYAAAMRRLSKVVVNTEIGSGRAERRNSAVSFERHPHAISEELEAAFAESSGGDEQCPPGAALERFASDRALFHGTPADEHEDEDPNEEIAIISKLDICIIDEEVNNRNLFIVEDEVNKNIIGEEGGGEDEDVGTGEEAPVDDIPNSLILAAERGVPQHDLHSRMSLGPTGGRRRASFAPQKKPRDVY